MYKNNYEEIMNICLAYLQYLCFSLVLMLFLPLTGGTYFTGVEHASKKHFFIFFIRPPLWLCFVRREHFDTGSHVCPADNSKR